ncbi:alpha/beta fold hydrolase [Paracoccus sp. p3-h83]|uniref:alpha/beta fold hydrolase n=1 Tax=Paracoccus sp. p3-h83 TaxID=3342805 RepID=UPI0035B9825C
MTRPGDSHQAAPLDLDLAASDAAPTGRAAWLRADDGVRLRVAEWLGRGARGTVLLFPGRTEYIEKYGPTAADLAERGYHVAVIDWRGQGLSDRLLARPEPGHVTRFADYQRDVAALIGHARARDLPRPWFVLAHSMGGAIALRALLNGLPVQAAAFSAPMWGIDLGALPQVAARAIAGTGRLLRMGGAIVPGSSRQTLVLTTDYAANPLTSDQAQFQRLRDHATARPDLVLGGPTLTWVAEALAECRALAALPSPDLPALTGLGTDEAVIAPQAIRDRMRNWPEGRLVPYQGARHELLMETPDIRRRFLDAVDALFRGARG